MLENSLHGRGKKTAGNPIVEFQIVEFQRRRDPLAYPRRGTMSERMIRLLSFQRARGCARPGLEPATKSHLSLSIVLAASFETRLSVNES